MSATRAGRIDAAARLGMNEGSREKQECCDQRMTIEETCGDGILSHLDNSISKQLPR
jgi:hypothetical protein